jgi:hypothetical protein
MRPTVLIFILCALQNLIFEYVFFGVMDVVNLALCNSLKDSSFYDDLYKDVNNKHLVVSATFLLNEISIFNMKIEIWWYYR